MIEWTGQEPVDCHLVSALVQAADSDNKPSVKCERDWFMDTRFDDTAVWNVSTLGWFQQRVGGMVAGTLLMTYFQRFVTFC